MSEELLLCPCGWTGGIDEQDALGTEMGCCPCCGNEDLEMVGPEMAEYIRLMEYKTNDGRDALADKA